MLVQQFFIEGLGCASYLIGSDAQEIAAVVDPQRDVRPYLEAARERGLKITHILETHLHADHVSGNTELAARTGAEIYLHAAAQAGFEHKPLNGGQVLQLGEVRIEVRHTPGHTPESVTLLVSDTTRPEEPGIALTGDLLFVGDVGRPDLVGAEAARGLAADLYDSLFEDVLKLDEALVIYPGHGAGSLCGRAIGSARSTTLGQERKFNPALAVTEKDRFIETMTTNLPEQPGNHQRIKAMNRRGPRALGEIRPQPLSVQAAIPHFQRGAGLLDARPKADYVQMHVPGSVHLEADDQLSIRVGFVLHPDQPVVLLLSGPADYEQVVYSLARVGYENVVGYLADGIAGWETAGLPVASGDIQDISAPELQALLESKNGDRPLVVDVREPWEYAQGHIPGAELLPLGQLAYKVNELDPTRPVAVVCASGSRSLSAAALLGQKGFARIYNLVDGMHGWQMAGLSMARV